MGNSPKFWRLDTLRSRESSTSSDGFHAGPMEDRMHTEMRQGGDTRSMCQKEHIKAEDVSSRETLQKETEAEASRPFDHMRPRVRRAVKSAKDCLTSIPKTTALVEEYQKHHQKSYRKERRTFFVSRGHGR